MLGAAASGIGSAAASAVGTSVGDEVYKYGKELFHDVSRRVDNDLENNYERLIEHAEKLCARRDDILAQAKTKQVTQVCVAWISRVMKIEQEVQELETKYMKEKSKKRTFNQLWNGSSESRAELNKSMAEKCEKWHNLWLEGKFEIGMVVKKLPERMYDNEKDSKVVLATRHRHVCYDMETDEEINVQRLSEASALQMFKVKVGRNANLPGIEPIAKLVVNECAGLPLLIDKVASIFRRKDNFHLWNDGLRSLRRWPSIKIQGINELIDYLKFCYEDLDDEVKKVCFLYGAIYPEDYEIYIDYLLECWRAEGFIHDANEFRDARGKGHSILDELINVSLLEKSEKINHFANGEGVDPIISDVLLETDAFELIGHKGASRLSDFGIKSINKMRGCLIEGCDEIETIVHCNSEGRSALECLEKMYINNVPKLESIWEGPIHAGSLARLTTLTLRRCLKLKKIFSNGMIEQLFKLEHLSIEECPEIEEIITESENNGLKTDAFPRLNMVVLSNLPKVKSIWTDDSLKWPSLESIKISMCQMLTRLPFNNDNAISLRCIEANQSWWSALVWQDDAIEKRLRSIWLKSSS
ncbi:disease resistance protein RPS2-like [Fagus crenata]